MHGHRSGNLFLFFLSSAFFLCCLSDDSIGGSAMPMQYLSRTELARIAGYGEETLSSVLVAGTVLCDACLGAGDAEFRGSYMQGVKVAVRCKIEGKKRTSWAHGITDEYGDFMIDLPSHLHGIPKLESACVVRILRAPRISPCHGADLKSKHMKLSSVGNNIRVYTTGVIRLGNSVSPGLCTRRKDEAENIW